MRAVLFGTYQAATHPRVKVLVEGLQAHGVDAAECNVPLGIDTAARVAILRQPWRLPWLAWRLARSWVALAWRARARRRADAVIVPYLAHFDVHLARLLFRRSVIVLDHLVSASDTARDRRERGALKLRLLDWLDRLALAAADVVMVDTEAHRGFLPERYEAKAVVVPVGAPAAWFSAGRSAAADGDGSTPDAPLRMIFFGLFTPLQGAPVIAEALSAIPGVGLAVTMVGTGQDRARVEAIAGRDPRICWVDWVPPEELPQLVASHDVCLGIFGTGPKAQRVVPNKVYQGAAAGCAIVTSDTDPQRRAFGDALVYVPAGDPRALATAIERLEGDREWLVHKRRSARATAAERFEPRQVVAPLLASPLLASPLRGAGCSPTGTGCGS